LNHHNGPLGSKAQGGHRPGTSAGACYTTANLQSANVNGSQKQRNLLRRTPTIPPVSDWE
jgi:hypothetical protein